MTKIAGSESGSGSISQRHGTADPDLHQNVMDPERCFVYWYLAGPRAGDTCLSWACPGRSRGGGAGPPGTAPSSGRASGSRYCPAPASSHAPAHQGQQGYFWQGFGSRFNQVSGSSGSGSTRAKMTHKSRIFLEFYVLKC
jgi:hypothetical protein